MDPYSLRRRLNDKQFEILTAADYLAKLKVVVDVTAPAVERKAAKDDLLNAHLRLIAGTISRILGAAGKGASRRIGIDESSDLFNAMAGQVYEELTSMAVAAAQGGFHLSSAIAHRVTMRMFSKFREAGAAMRQLKFASPKVLAEYADPDDPLGALEALLVEEAGAELKAAYSELKAAASGLPGNQGLVFQTLIYGIETDQGLTIADVARELNIKETTARSAYHKAKETLQRRYPEMGNGEAH